MGSILQESVYRLFADQLDVWELARNNYDALGRVKVKEYRVGGGVYRVQFNPARITSSTAKVDPGSIRERKCFLCSQNLPPQQEGIPYAGHYLILVNPYPIFPKHLTIPRTEHVRQSLEPPALADMLRLAGELPDFVVFYNGPECGASAPDHLHFQAGNKGFLPIESDWRSLKAGKITEQGPASLWYLDDAPRATLVIESTDECNLIALFETVIRAMQLMEGGGAEPKINVLAWREEDTNIVCLFPRKKHRPACYFAGGEDNMLISPASVDMGGVFIVPREKDFDKITAEDIRNVLGEVSPGKEEFRKLRETIKELL